MAIKYNPTFQLNFGNLTLFFKYLEIYLKLFLKNLKKLLIYYYLHFLGVPVIRVQNMTVQINKLVGIRLLIEEGKISTACVALNIEKIVCDELQVRTNGKLLL